MGLRSSRGRGEQGSTLLSVLVAMVVLSLVGICAWSAASTAVRVAGRVRARAMMNARLLLLDRCFREEALRIRPPWWGRIPEIEGGEGDWRIPYREGAADACLAITWRGGRLCIDNGERILMFGGFTSVSLKAVREDATECRRLVISLEGIECGSLAIEARMGGMPLENGASR
jgi:hypothetical protein